MSFRELRNFVEIMKALGYRRQLSLETFRSTNFSAMAECLHWLVTRYDPSADFAVDVSTEAARTQFVNHAVHTMLSRARIKMNSRNLYAAKGLAVREMLKIAQVLYDALRAYDNDESKTAALPAVSLSKLDEMKAARTLATEIVESGSKLFGLLEKEDQYRKSRDSAIQFLDSMSLNLESNDPHDMIEKTVREEINTLSESVTELERTTASMETDREQLQSKLERKQTELERTEQRLRSMKKVRPAFMDEYEQHETELKSVYEVYMERFRNLSFLESELSKLQDAEAEKKVEADKHLKKMRRRLRDEELRILRGEAVDDGADDPDAMRAAMAARASGIRSDRARRSDEITDEDEDGDDNDNDEDAEEEAEDDEEEEEAEETPRGPSHPSMNTGPGAGRTKPVGRVDFF